MHSLTTWLVHLPTWPFLTLVVLISIVAGELLRRAFRLVDKKRRLRAASAAEDSIVGYVFGFCGVVYAVMLAFVIVTAWQEKDHAEEVVLDEQNAVASLLTIVNSYEDTADIRVWRNNLREDLRVYALSVSDDWERLVTEHGVALAHTEIVKEGDCGVDPKAHARRAKRSKNTGGDVTARAAACIAFDVGHWVPKTLYEQADYQASLSILQSFLSSRAHRIHYSNERLPPIMWASLIAGAVVMLLSTFLFAEQAPVSQAIRTATLAAVLGIMFAQALVFDHPFIGPSRIDDSRWQDIAHQFEK